MKALLVQVRVVANAKSASVVDEGGALKVRVCAKPVEGKANREVVRLLAEYYGVPEGSVRVVRGARSRLKRVEIAGQSTRPGP